MDEKMLVLKNAHKLRTIEEGSKINMRMNLRLKRKTESKQKDFGKIMTARISGTILKL
jgi:hypothetical protein